VLWAVTASGAMTIGWLCALSLLLGIANAAYHPARLSIVNEVAPPGRLAEAIATNSILFNLARSVGPALAGISIAALGIAATFAINAISYLAVVASLLAITMRSTQRRPSAGFISDFIEGLRYAAGHRFIRDLMLLSFVTSSLGRGVVELLPAFAGGVYDRGSSGLAALTTATGIGAVIGGMFLSRSGRDDGLSTFAHRSAMLVGVAVAAFGLTPNYFSGLVAILVLGIVTVMSNVGLQVVLQKSIDEAFRGRILGLWGMCNVAGPGIGGALLGALAQGIGVRGATVCSGVLCIGLTVWIVRRRPDRKINTF
jgi:MFS family permease